MASSFNLTAQINLRGPTNLRPIVSQIRKQLGSIDGNINLKIDNKAAKSVDAVTNRLSSMNKVLIDARNNTLSLNQSLRELSGSLGSIQTSSNAAASGVNRTSQSVGKVSKDIKIARTEMEEFGRQSSLAVRRFAAFSGPTILIFSLTSAITSAFRAFIDFDKQLVKLQQVTGRGAIGVKILQDEITNLATSLGVGSASLIEVASTLAQAGLNIEETRIALRALAKTELAPSFENLTKTTEGAIAVLRQFGLEASELEGALGSINAVAAAFAVESGDIIAAIQRTGGVFASASKGVSEGTDALNEFVAIFTSVRQTTRESAETIATGLRTIFTRIQRAGTIKQLREFGVELQDLEGKFVGPFEAVKRLSEALNQLDPRDVKFSTIIEELGGFRQIGKVIPLIQQFAVAQQALGVAQRGQSSLSDAQVKAQESLANQISKVREQFLALIRDIGQSTVFQGFFKIVLGLTSGLISLAGAFKPILPILAIIGAIKGVSAIGQFATGFFGGMKKGGGGGAGGAGQNIGETLSGAKEKQRAEATSKAADATKLNTDALKSLTTTVQNLDNTIKNISITTLASGGKVLGFNKGGVVPGSGRGDKVPALLEPGEVVMNNSAVNKYGRGNLVRMNKYAKGGEIFKRQIPGALQKMKDTPPIGYNDISKLKINNSGKGSIRGYFFENFVNKEFGVDAPENTFPDIPNLNVKKGLKERLGLTKSQTGRDFKAAELKYRSGITPDFDDQYTPENTAVLYAVNKNFGGIIQKFMAGSPRGISVASGKGRGVKRRKGARSYVDPISTETYSEFAKDIYAEYDGDPSLVMAAGPGGLRRPPELALLDFLLAKIALEESGAGLSAGQKFVRTPSANITDELRPYLVPDPSDPNELGFFKDDILKFGKLKKIPQQVSSEISQRKTTSKMQRELFGFALEGVGADIEAGNFSKDKIETLKEGLPDIAKNPYLQVTSLPRLKGEAAPASSSLLGSIGGPLSEFRKSGGQTSLSGVIPEAAAKQIEAALPGYIDSVSDDSQKLSKAKTTQKYFRSFVGGGTAEKPGHATAFAETINQMLKSGAIQGLANGGMVQRFMAGSIGGVAPSLASMAGVVPQTTPFKPGESIEDIIEQIEKMNGGAFIRQQLGVDSINSKIQARYEEIIKPIIAELDAKQASETKDTTASKSGRKKKELPPEIARRLALPQKPSASQILDKGWLTSSKNNPRDRYLSVLQDIVAEARPIFDEQELSKQQQISRNLQAEAGEVYQFGLASIYGPNGELGYSGLSDAKEIETKDGQKLNTQIVRRGLPKRYEDDVQKTRQDIAALSSKAAERFLYTNIFGTGGPLAFDFDDTLVKNADIFDKAGGIDIEGYNDLAKVEEALKNAELTLLGKELKRRVGEDPKLSDNIRVLTARPQSNAPYLASTLSRLELPIPESKITGVSGGLNKVNNLSELETLIDDNLENIQSVTSGGKKATLYKEPRNLDLSNPSSLRSMQVIEGYTLEDMVRDQTGINITSDDVLDDPLKPIDFPNGLGAYASMWNMPPNIPTDTKRSNTSTASSVMFERAEKFYNDNLVPAFAFGGKADGPGFEEIRQQIIDKYPEIDFGIRKRKKSSGFGYNLTGALKATGGLSGKDSVNFQQPTNLKQLQEYSDKLASKLMNPQELAVGGLVDSPEKNFGKVALRTGSRIQATYFKEGEAGAARSGQVIADSIGNGLYSVQSSSATKGYGPKLYDIVMEAATAAGSMLTSDRKSVSTDAKKVWDFYFNNRADVTKTPLDPENWVSNSRLLDPKLYGPPETWPAPTDPAWILQSGYSKAPSDINDANLVQKLARGGSANTVPAMVSNGEAFVPPNIAKKIGYSKLDKMNQADRNGMKGFSAGGISTFKGAGNGTSDSIGPVGLPIGSYVVREKATRALGLNKGGSVGVQKFAAGGGPDPLLFERSILTTIETALELDSKRLGVSISDLAKELKKTADETRKAALAAGKTKAEANKAAREAAGQKLGLDTLYQSDFGFLEQQIQGRPEKQVRVKAAERDNISGGDILETGQEQRQRIKEKFTATNRGGITRQEAYDAGALRPDYQSSGPGKGGTSTQVKVDLAAEALLAPVREEILKRYAKIYDEEKKGIADFYQQKVNKALAAGEEITPIVNEAKAVLAETKAKLTQGAQLEVGTATSSATILSSERMEGLKASKDPFYAAGKAAESYASGGSSNSKGLPKVNPKIAEERQQYLQFKAEQSGMNVGGYKYSMAQKIGQSKFNVERETVLGRTETRASATGRRRELEGIKVKDSLKADTQEGRRVQSIVDEFAANLQKADPSLGAGKARDAAIALAEGLSDGTKSVEKIISANETLKTTLDGNIDSTKIMEEAFRRTALEMGESVENLKANVSNKQIEQQSFIKGTEGQRFGALAEFAPGLTEKISKTRGGKALASGADFISGKGGKISKGFAGAGGFTGIGAGLAVGAEGLKQLLPKSVTSDPNTAGALGALSGAGTGAAMGAQIGSIAGPIGTLIGGVGGAIIGGIQGFFNAKNQAILTNAIENVAKTTGGLDIAFKKLEADASAVNLKSAQKAFGEVLGAQKDIRGMAFTSPTLTGTDAMSIGGTALAGAGTGAAAGALIGSMVPILGTAVGAAVGGGLGGVGGAAYAYMNRPSSAQREEALGATIQQSGANQESATRLAESQLKMTSTEDIDKILKGMDDGISSLNPIVEQYAKGMALATGQTVEQVKGQAEEQAALDAFMKLRKEAGATDEAIGKELEKDSKGAISIGKEALQANAQLLVKQQLLARATKEVAIATESLLDVYRRINAEAERYSGELEQFGADIDAMVGGLGGDTSMRAVNRQNEQVLGNVSAYSTDEVRSAANASAGLLGGTPEAQNLANQAVAQKVIQDQIPALLRNAKNPGEEEQAIGQIRALLESQGLGGAAIDTVLTDLENTMAEGTKSGTGTSEQDLQDQIDRSFSTVGKGLEALQNVTKKYNDTLQQARKFQADYNKAVLEAGSYLRKATQVRLNAELDLAKALGRSPTLEELNKPFDVEVGNLTGKLVESGDLAAGAASDPMAIAAAISSAERRKQDIEQNAPGLTGAAANIPGGEAGDPLRQELNQAQIDNISAIGDLTIASAEGRQALEKLATDGTKAANALAKIQEEQQALEGFAAFAQNVFTAEPQELAKMELQATALNAAQASGPEFMKSRNNRQQAFAGLEQEKQFLTPQEYRDAQGDLLRKSFESQGKKGDDVVRKIGGKEFTLDQFIERVKGGVDQTDPNVVAFREASEVQAKANEALGKLNMEQAFIIQDAMLRLEFFLSDKFPEILKNAQTNAETDSQTKPEVKSEVKPKGPSIAESNVTRGEALVKSGKERVAAAEKEYEELPFYSRGRENVGRINKTINKANEDIRTGRALVSTNKPIAEKDKAARTTEASLEASQRSSDETLKKAEETEKNKAKAEEAINKAKETRNGGRPQMVGTGGQTASGYTPRNEAERQAQAEQATQSRFGGIRAPIQAPPAPGTQQQATQSVVSTVDPIAEAIRKDQETEASVSLERFEGSKKSKEKDIAKLQNRARAERMAAKAAGTYTGPTKSEAALATDEQTLASINEQITEQKQKLAVLKPSGGLNQSGTLVSPTVSGGPSDPPTSSEENLKQKTDAEVKSATEEVKASVTQLQSPLDLVAQMATSALQSGSIYTHDVGLQEGIKQLIETVGSVGEFVSSGLIVNDAQVLQALNNLQVPFAVLEQMATASLSEGINTKDVTLASILSTLKPALDVISNSINTLLAPINSITSILGPILDGIAAPIKGIAGYLGVELSTPQALGLAVAGPAGYAAGTGIDAINAINNPPVQSQPQTPATPNRLELANTNSANRVVSAPVPVTMPPQASFTNQQITTQQEPTTPTTAQTLTIDSNSIEKLNTFNTNFASYVDKLVSLEFPTIPDVIEMKGSHVVDVRISGAAAFEGLKKDFESMMQKEIQKAMGKIWGQSNGQLGQRPAGTESPE